MSFHKNLKITFIHAHIPKTGGTSFNATFAKQFKKGEKFSYHAENKIVFHNMPYYSRRALKAVFGHVDLMFHKNLPNIPIYLFILREPTERIYSIYKYISKRKDHPLHNKIANMNFNDFISNSVHDFNIYDNIYNIQSKYIAGLIGVRNVSAEEIKAFAISNLLNLENRYGFIHDYNSFLKKLNEEFGWNLEEYKENVTQKKKINKNDIMNMLKKENMLLIEKCVEVDIYIYNYLLDKYE